MPDDDELSEHLTSRAEVAEALTLDGGPDVVWLGAAMILGAGSTSFEMLRYVGDRFLLIPMPPWATNPIDPISISDVLLLPRRGRRRERVPPGSYDIRGPETTSYGDLLLTYARLSRAVAQRSGRAGRRHWDWCRRWPALFVPVPGGLAADLIESLDYPMMASERRAAPVRARPARRPGRHRGRHRAVAVQSAASGPSNASPTRTTSPTPTRTGRAATSLRSRKLAAMVTPALARPALGLLGAGPGTRRRLRGAPASTP